MSRRARLALLGLFGALAVPTACSKGEPAAVSGADGGAANPEAGGAPDDGDASGPADPNVYARALCAYDQKCDSGFFKRQWNDMTACVAEQLPLTTAALHARGNVVTQAELAACVARLGVPSCDQALGTVPECDFHGTLENGSPCSFSGQCSSGSCFFEPAADGGAQSCGTCTARVDAGGDCTHAQCSLGLGCLAGKCVTIKHLGDSCDPANDCAVPLECTGGRCVAATGKDQPCDSSAPTCDVLLDLICVIGETTAGTCRNWQYANLGETCGVDRSAMTITGCIASDCDYGSGDLGKCVPYVAAGASCTSQDGCAYALGCFGGKCAPEQARTCP